MSAQSKQPVLLIVEDERTVSMALRHFAEQLGFQVFIAYNLSEAITLAESIQPDYISLDLVLPDSRDPKATIDQIPTLQSLAPNAAIGIFSGYDTEEVKTKLKTGLQDSYGFKHPENFSREGFGAIMAEALQKKNPELHLKIMSILLGREL